MNLLTTIGLAVITQLAGVTTIQERAAPSRVLIRKASGTIEFPTVPRFEGKLGWGFDADPRCRTYVIEPTVSTPKREGSADSKLMAYGEADKDAGVVLARSPGGFSSPAVSPDSTALLIVRGPDELVRLNLLDGGEAALGSAWFGFWGTDGLITTYTRRRDGCHLWRQLTDAGRTVKEVSRCGGYTVVPIASGIAPPGAPIVIVDASGHIVDLLGADRPPMGENVQLSLLERGAACREGIDFVAADGGPITLTNSTGHWAVRVGTASCSPVETRRGFVKVVTCGALR